MNLSAFVAYCEGLLEGTAWEGVAFHAGPDDQQAPPGKFVLVTRTGGAGFTMEQLFDRIGYQVVAVGEQYSYDDAEGLALALDQGLTNTRSQTFENMRLLSIQRQGGSPAPLNVDDADRTRFACNYILEVESYPALEATP